MNNQSKNKTNNKLSKEVVRIKQLENQLLDREKQRLANNRARALGIARDPVRRVLSTQGKGGPQEKLARIIGKDGVSAFDFALSPADFDCTVGLPDGAMPKSIPLTLKMDFVMATTTTNPTWNLAVLTLPSIDYPVVCIGYPNGVNPFQFFNNLSNVLAINVPLSEGVDSVMRNYSSTGYSVYIPQWSATQITSMRGPIASYNAAAPNYTVPAGWPTMTTYNVDGSLPSNNSVKGFMGIGTTQGNSIQSWRCCGQSVTTCLSASAIANEGMVSTRPLSRAARQGLQTGTMFSVYDQAAGATTATLSSNVTCPTFSLDNLPTSRSDLVAAEHSYTGVAKDGTYTVSHYVGGGKTFMDTDVNRGVLAFSNFTAPAAGTERDTDYFACWPMIARLNQGQGTVSSSVVCAPLVLGIDQNWTPTLTIYEGIDKTATVDVKVIMGAQCTATNNGGYASVGKIVAQPSLMFPEVLASTMKAMPPGGPASDNWEWSDIGRWIKTALETVVMVAPFLLPLL